jgi:alcohol dehydrogenase class IV
VGTRWVGELMALEVPVGEFNLSRLEKVIFGPGKIQSLEGELERRGLQRALVVTADLLADTPLLHKVVKAAGSRCAAVFADVRQHVPFSVMRELKAEIERSGADCLVSLGGGSPIDMCKVAAYSILTGLDLTTTHALIEGAKPGVQAGRELIHIAVPTTLSAAEYTHVAGVTDDSTRVKEGVSDPRLQPRTVINDPALTLDTPEWLWVSTGIRALDHAVEVIYAIRHQPISDALASKAISLLVEHLPASILKDSPDQLAHRGHCQLAAWYSIYGSMNTRFGLSHLLGHQIGPRWDVPHGVTSCITLPHAMRFMAEIAPQRFGPIAEGFGVPFNSVNPKPAALECADRAAQFIAKFDVPSSLGAAGVPRNEIGQVAGTIAQALEQSQVMDRPLTREEVVTLLEAAY